jgi:hypothetical protein
MGQISMATRDELVVALAGRYASSRRKERGRILDEFAAFLRNTHAGVGAACRTYPDDFARRSRLLMTRWR